MFFKRFKRIRPHQITVSYCNLFFFPFLADFSRDGLIVTARSKNTICRNGVGRGNWRNGASKTPRYNWKPKNQENKNIRWGLGSGEKYNDTAHWPSNQGPTCGLCVVPFSSVISICSGPHPVLIQSSSCRHRVVNLCFFLFFLPLFVWCVLYHV